MSPLGLGVANVSIYEADISRDAGAAKGAAKGASQRLSVGMWCWMGTIVFGCLLAWRFGVRADLAAACAALALWPAVITILMLGRWGESWARTLSIYSWIAFAAVAASVSGAMTSPAIAAFLLAPAVAANTLDRERVVEATLFAGLGALAAASLAAAGPVSGASGLTGLGELPALLGAASLIFAGGLVASAIEHPQDAPPRARPVLAQGVAGAIVNVQGAALAFTPAFARLLGLNGRLQRGGLVGEALSGAVDEPGRQSLGHAIAAACGGEERDVTLVLKAIDRPDRVAGVSVRPAGAGLAGLTALDVSGVSRALGEANAALEAVADANAAASRHIGEVSHELRTPLTHIIGFAELMERSVFGPLPEKYADYAGLIRASGSHLLSLVNDLVDLSRLKEGRLALEPGDFNASDVAAEVAALSQGSAHARNIALTLQAPSAPLLVHADARAVRQMLLNVVGNAIKYTPDGGRVRLEMRAEGASLVMDTHDSGPGLSAADKESLGVRFVRGDAAGGAAGSGLGLSLVRGLAELHGGTLSFQDAPEGGALVRISLPVLLAGD